MGWERAPRACTTQKGRVTGEIVGAGGLRWLLRALGAEERLGERDDKRAPPGSEREEGGVEGAGVGLFGPSRPKARGEIDLFFFFKLIFKTSFQLNFE